MPSRYRKTTIAGAPMVLSEGALYVASTDDRSYFVIKVLKLGDGPPLIRIYSNTFTERPESLDESWLYVADKQRQPGAPGAERLVANDEFLRDWSLTFVQNSTATRARSRRRPTKVRPR